MAQKLAEALRNYRGDNEWEDVIHRGDGGWLLDEDATGAADPGYRGDVAVCVDGSAVVWDEVDRCWVPRDPEWVARYLLGLD